MHNQVQQRTNERISKYAPFLCFLLSSVSSFPPFLLSSFPPFLLSSSVYRLTDMRFIMTPRRWYAMRRPRLHGSQF